MFNSYMIDKIANLCDQQLLKGIIIVWSQLNVSTFYLRIMPGWGVFVDISAQ